MLNPAHKVMKNYYVKAVYLPMDSYYTTWILLSIDILKFYFLKLLDK